ncbi:hypothetical protein G6N74_23825 [Mesorhizobium sp. CGMCC 1.15528]|uniref:Uncharacterized protein n=1 Tax=Mesorhizobium zhangyense TaxID=1776730 RepID=A0A7C9RAA7_9HYPH|nr:hypothetical protein [Mesorhizobium zhangyense]NGN44101.1 hypothetical protein [Mesorhizobium zhangyense]
MFIDMAPTLKFGRNNRRAARKNRVGGVLKMPELQKIVFYMRRIGEQFGAK